MLGLTFSLGHGFCYADSESLSYPALILIEANTRPSQHANFRASKKPWPISLLVTNDRFTSSWATAPCHHIVATSGIEPTLASLGPDLHVMGPPVVHQNLI